MHLARLVLTTALCGVLMTLATSCRRSSDSAATARMTVTIAVEQNPTSLDPIRVLDVHSHAIAAAVHAPLALVDTSGSVVGVIAESILMAEDGLSCRIVLHDGATFWDGSPVNASDVAFSIERLRRSGHPHVWILERIFGIDAFDSGETDRLEGLTIEGPASLSVRFTEPDPMFPWLISSGLTAVVKRGSDDRPTEPFDQHVIGAGPFMPARLDPGDRFVLVRNDGFPTPSKIETLEFRVIADPQNQLNAMARGQIDVIRLRGAMIEEAARRGGDGQLVPRERFRGASIVAGAANELAFLIMNWNSIPQSPPAVADRRRLMEVLSAAIDRQLVVDRLYMGQAERARSVAPPSVLSVAARSSDDTNRSEDASARFADALILLSANDPDSRRLAAYVQERARAVDWPMQASALELGQLVERLLGGQHQLALFWVEQQISGGILPWMQFFRTDSPFARVIGQPIDGISDALATARSILDRDERERAFSAIIEQIDAEQVAWIPLVSRSSVLLVSDRIDGNLVDANGVVYWTNLTLKD